MLDHWGRKFSQFVWHIDSHFTSVSKYFYFSVEKSLRDPSISIAWKTFAPTKLPRVISFSHVDISFFKSLKNRWDLCRIFNQKINCLCFKVFSCFPLFWWVFLLSPLKLFPQGLLSFISLFLIEVNFFRYEMNFRAMIIEISACWNALPNRPALVQHE